MGFDYYMSITRVLVWPRVYLKKLPISSCRVPPVATSNLSYNTWYCRGSCYEGNDSKCKPQDFATINQSWSRYCYRRGCHHRWVKAGYYHRRSMPPNETLVKLLSKRNNQLETTEAMLEAVWIFCWSEGSSQTCTTNHARCFGNCRVSREWSSACRNSTIRTTSPLRFPIYSSRIFWYLTSSFSSLMLCLSTSISYFRTSAWNVSSMLSSCFKGMDSSSYSTVQSPEFVTHCWRSRLWPWVSQCVVDQERRTFCKCKSRSLWESSWSSIISLYSSEKKDDK